VLVLTSAISVQITV